MNNRRLNFFGLVLWVLAMVFQTSAVFSAPTPLYGEGYGADEKEAKKEALADLASIIKVRVYSKYESSSYNDGKNSSSNSVRFIKLISDAPILNPEITYFKERGGVKAVASITNAEAYIDKLNSIAQKINNMLANISRTDNDALKFNLLEALLPLYDEYDLYEIVPKLLDNSSYDKPATDREKVLEEYLKMTELPPDLNIAADILTRGLEDRRNIFVTTPLTSIGDEVTEFGLFFQKLLKAKVISALQERADYKFNCSYAPSQSNLLMVCSLISGGTALKSTAVKIPIALVSKLNYKPKPKNLSDYLEGTVESNDLKAAVRISPETNPNILRDGEYFTILARLNKPAYVYVVAYPSVGRLGASGIVHIGGDGGFLRKIDDEDTGRWVGLGRFKAGDPLAVGEIQLFAIEDKPKDEKQLLPTYLQNKFYNNDKDRGEVAADIISIFKKLLGNKTSATVSIQTSGKSQ